MVDILPSPLDQLLQKLAYLRIKRTYMSISGTQDDVCKIAVAKKNLILIKQLYNHHSKTNFRATIIILNIMH